MWPDDENGLPKIRCCYRFEVECVKYAILIRSKVDRRLS